MSPGGGADLLVAETAIVTGATRGIGRAVAQAISREGAQVLLTDVGTAEGSSIAAALSKSGAACAFIAADLADPTSPQRVFEEAIRRFGKVSIFVHCASPSPGSESALRVSNGDWQRMFAVNVMSAYQFAQLIGDHMRSAAVRGKILLVTSLHAETPRARPHYSASKAALTMLMKELARALSPHGIRVNAIAPGAVSENSSFGGAEVYTSATPMQRLGRPDEIANLAVALLSDKFSSFVTGTTVVVDGGLSLYNWLPEKS